MPDGIQIPGGPVFIGSPEPEPAPCVPGPSFDGFVSVPGGPEFEGHPQPPDVPCDPVGDAWRGEPGPAGPMGPPGPDSNSVINVLDHGAAGDGITNDTAAIQSALNTYAGKAVVFIPATGQPYMTGPLVLPTGTDLLLHGTLKMIAGQVQGMVTFSNASNISIRGHGVLDGNSAAQSVNGSSTFGGNNGTNVRVEGITLQNAFNWNINITASSNVRIDRVTVTGGGNSNEFAAGCNNCWITNSYISGPGNDGGFTFYGGVTNSGITGCVVTNSHASGIGVYADGPQPAVCSNIVIANNIVHHNTPGGISVVTQVTGDPLHTGITITGNRCYANANSGNPVYADVWVTHGTGITISGNDLSGAGSGANATYGVFVGVHSNHINIVGNTIWNEGQGGTAGAGVYIQAANNVIVSANHIYDNQPTHTMTKGIDGNCGSQCVIMGNSFGENMGANALTAALGIDTIVANGLQAGTGNQLTVSNLANIGGLFLVGPGAYLTYDNATTGGGTKIWSFVDGSNNNCMIRPDGVVDIRTAMFVNGTRVIAPRVTGWGGASGGSKVALNAATATLPQTAAAVAQLINDLTNHGLIGA